MGIRRILGAVAALTMFAACGDPGAVGSPDGSSGEVADTSNVATPTNPGAAASASDIAICTDPPFTAGGNAVARNASELADIQARALEMVDYGIDVSAFARASDGVVEVDLPILDESTLDAVRKVFGGDLDAICVTGADPATVPPDGPQPSAGDGWRLLTDQTRHGEPYSVDVAVNDTEYESLWASLALDGDRPSVDFATEIVIHFGAVYSGSCPEIRLDGVNFDVDRSLVTAHVVQLGGNRTCTADANTRAYLVAVDKSRLPTLPFTVSLQPDCSYCSHVEIATLEGTQSPAATLSESDLSQILAAASAARVGTGYDTVDIVEVVGQTTPDGFVDLEQGVALTEGERSVISQALGSRTVRFVSVPAFDQIVPTEHYAVLSIAVPVVSNGQLTITTALWCGSLCGSGGASEVVRLDDGSWTISGPAGPQWIA